MAEARTGQDSESGPKTGTVAGKKTPRNKDAGCGRRRKKKEATLFYTTCASSHKRGGVLEEKRKDPYKQAGRGKNGKPENWEGSQEEKIKAVPDI